MQLPRQLAAATRMPSPVRTREAFGDGLPVLREAYAIESIPLADVQRIGGNSVRLAIEDVLAENGDHHEEPVGFSGRLGEIRFVWDSINDLPPELAGLVAEHRALVTGRRANPPRGWSASSQRCRMC